MRVNLDIHQDQLAEFCSRWQVSELSIFGSMARGEARPDSDIDILISFDSAARWSLLDHANMEAELSDLLGREVDLVSRRAVERSHNWIRRQSILADAVPIYVAG